MENSNNASNKILVRMFSRASAEVLTEEEQRLMLDQQIIKRLEKIGD